MTDSLSQSACNPWGLPVSGVDPFSMEFLDDPFPIYEQLRETGPVVWLESYGVWAAGRLAEVHAILNDWETFCSGRGGGLSDFAKEKPWRPPSLITESDGHKHSRVRAVLNRVLSPAAVRSLRERFADAADRLVGDLLAQGGRFDAVADLAEAFPLDVFSDAVGLCSQGREHLLPYARAVFNALGPDNKLRRDSLAAAAPHVAWVAEQCRRENLLPGGFGADIYAATDTGEITPEEASLLVRSLLGAGLDTTGNGIGAALYCMARFPEQFDRLRQTPSLARQAFDEAVRFESPVQAFFRTTTRPAEIGGVPLGEGEKVLVLLGSANRDPRFWDAPNTYDITRRTTGHVGFGHGVHMCVGQLLARLEGECIMVALARRVSAIKIVGTPERRYNNTLRGLASLPVEITAHRDNGGPLGQGQLASH